MKKIKKIIVPLLVILCIPLFLAGCGSKEAFVASSQNKNGEIWLSLSNSNKVHGIYYIKGNNFTYYYIHKAPLSDFAGKSNSQVLSLAKQKASDSCNESLNAKIVTDDNKKVLKEKICSSDSPDDVFVELTSTNVKIKSDGKTYYGYETKVDGDKGKLISNSGKQVAFDNDKTNNVEQVNQEND